jgi:hypothetical protein
MAGSFRRRLPFSFEQLCQICTALERPGRKTRRDHVRAQRLSGVPEWLEAIPPAHYRQLFTLCEALRAMPSRHELEQCEETDSVPDDAIENPKGNDDGR